MRRFIVFAFMLQALALAAVEKEGFEFKPDLAQYKGSNYSNVVQVERGITLDEAFEIAENNPEIDYFFYTKGETMVLELPADTVFAPEADFFHLIRWHQFIWDSDLRGEGFCRVFRHGDAVFFSEDGKWLGSAPGLADVYCKVK